jgi:hypothetical protein
MPWSGADALSATVKKGRIGRIIFGSRFDGLQQARLVGARWWGAVFFLELQIEPSVYWAASVGNRTVENGALQGVCVRRWDFLNEFLLRIKWRRRAVKRRADPV